MSHPKAKDLRGLSSEEMRLKIEDLRKQLFALRGKKTTGQLEKPHEFKQARRQIARIMTLQREARHGKP